MGDAGSALFDLSDGVEEIILTGGGHAACADTTNKSKVGSAHPTKIAFNNLINFI